MEIWLINIKNGESLSSWLKKTVLILELSNLISLSINFESEQTYIIDEKLRMNLKY